MTLADLIRAALPANREWAMNALLILAALYRGEKVHVYSGSHYNGRRRELHNTAGVSQAEVIIEKTGIKIQRGNDAPAAGNSGSISPSPARTSGSPLRLRSSTTSSTRASAQTASGGRKMTSYVTSRDGQKITARKIREALEAIPAPEPKINLALRLLSDAYRYGTLDAYPSGEGSPYAGYVSQLLGLHTRSAPIENWGFRFYFRKNKKFAEALAWMADYALDD